MYFILKKYVFFETKKLKKNLIFYFIEKINFQEIFFNFLKYFCELFNGNYLTYSHPSESF